jgi:hypothetical protein
LWISARIRAKIALIAGLIHQFFLDEDEGEAAHVRLLSTLP